MTDTGQSEYRSKAEEIIRRAETDKAFADQAKADPLGTLTGAGIPTDVARQMLGAVRARRRSPATCAAQT